MDEARLKAKMARSTRTPGPGAYEPKRPGSDGGVRCPCHAPTSLSAPGPGSGRDCPYAPCPYHAFG